MMMTNSNTYFKRYDDGLFVCVVL